MHILQLESPVELAADDIIQPGEYLCEATNGAQLLCIANGGTLNELHEERPFDETKDWNERSILFVRSGGIGDLVLLTPILREIKRRWPSAKIHVACMKEYGQALLHLPFVDRVIPFPISTVLATDYDCWVFLENVIERGPESKHMHSVDLVAKHIGLTGDFDKNQEYRVTLRENIWAEEAYPRTGTKRICVQANASARCRSYPPPLLSKIIGELLRKGWQVFLMGGPSAGLKVEKDHAGLVVMADGFTLRQRCAVIANSDCVLAPDSALTHIAGALAIPCVALYSVFKWQQRTKYSPTTVGVNAVGDCTGCNHHAHMSFHFPKDGPCAKVGYCVPLAEIKPERIIALIETNAKGFKLEVVEGPAG